MIFGFPFALVVFMSTAEGRNEIYVHQYQTLAECMLVEKDMVGGLAQTKNPDTVVLGCRETLSLNLGSAAKLPVAAK